MLFGVCLGFWFPGGFHSRAAFAMSPGGRRIVWPSHRHFLCRISNSIGLSLALAHSSWFDIWTGQEYFQHSADASIDQNLQLMYDCF